MAADGILPDIKTFSILLKMMPHDEDQEQCLIRTMDALDVAPDVGFFNQLMKKRASSRRNAAAKSAFRELEARALQPDVASFGCLAMTVRNGRDLASFWETLRAADVRPNVEMLTTLLNSAVRAADPQRALAVMEAFIEHQVAPERRVLLQLEELRLNLRQMTVAAERGRPPPRAAQQPSFADSVRKFLLRYPRWLAEVHVERERHPFRQYAVRPLAETVAAAGLSGAEEAPPQRRPSLPADG
ncbi:pentatricopeptide repeat-containing protein 1, mitochondrial-like [Pollicipes pollicipes]|uniref:pentatricopeptide repeat-containing protein 1, mitochondrial-like n=1 Tax=Pollicipes pollicipes TaxID=41117 RepID=UPI0018851CBE|nr:pentatricopeptide repeat-containing protein 1, mitochondrial-like [Pollicipes pollicipes]